MFKDNVPNRKIERDSNISPFKVNKVMNQSKESGGVLVRKGEASEACDYQSMRHHCIKNCIINQRLVTTWVKDYVGEPLSSTTLFNYIHKCH